MVKRTRCLLVVSLFLALPISPARAWSEHSMGTWPALNALPEVKDAPPIKAERIETFLKAEQKGLMAVLKEEEAWARQNVPTYPPRPDALEFRDGDDPALLKEHFLNAIRLNPDARLELFIQPLPGTDLTGKPLQPASEVTTLKNDLRVNATPYVALKEGDPVSALEVASTGADEPDHGLDIGVWSNNKTEYGKAYQYGPQPFGNPTLEYSSQAPFHMGFFHEAGIVYKAAGWVKHTYPEARVHMYLSLARYALKSGHPYWGWRFAGWGLHYIQDLSQPYHSTLVPGVSAARLIWLNTIDLIGIHGPKRKATQLVTNRHLALENYQFFLMHESYETHQIDNAVMKALGNTSSDAGFGHFTGSYPRDVLTVESHGRGKSVDKSLSRWLPKQLVSDPDYLFETTDPNVNVYQVVNAGKPEARREMETMLAGLMQSFGSHSRNFVRAVLAP